VEQSVEAPKNCTPATEKTVDALELWAQELSRLDVKKLRNLPYRPV
jgi:hypothetical protein